MGDAAEKLKNDQAHADFRFPDTEDDDVLTSAGKLTEADGSFSGGIDNGQIDEIAKKRSLQAEKEFLDVQDEIGDEALRPDSSPNTNFTDADARPNSFVDVNAPTLKLERRKTPPPLPPETLPVAPLSTDELIADSRVRFDQARIDREARQQAGKTRAETLRDEINNWSQDIDQLESQRQQAAELQQRQRKAEEARADQIQTVRNQIAAWNDGTDNSAIQTKEQAKKSAVTEAAIREDVTNWSQDIDQLEAQEGRVDTIRNIENKRKIVRDQAEAWENGSDNTAIESKEKMDQSKITEVKQKLDAKVKNFLAEYTPTQAERAEFVSLQAALTKAKAENNPRAYQTAAAQVEVKLDKIKSSRFIDTEESWFKEAQTTPGRQMMRQREENQMILDEATKPKSIIKTIGGFFGSLFRK